MMQLLVQTGKILLIIYVVLCSILFFFQEKFIFFPAKLDRAFRFSFGQKFEELFIPAPDGKKLNGLLFTCARPKGLVFYLHGNAGALDSWGDVAARYTGLQYDVFILDYRGYGKSEGSIRSQQQLFGDVQAAYNEMKARYREDRIVVLGYSIGTGPASWLASVNRPRLLILQAPYYSLTDMMRQVYPIIPTFLLKYKLKTHQYLQDCRMPVVLFHGDRDEVIPYRSSLKLKEVLKEGDTLITLNGLGHNGMTDHPQYIRALGDILNR